MITIIIYFSFLNGKLAIYKCDFRRVNKFRYVATKKCYAKIFHNFLTNFEADPKILKIKLQ